MTYNYEFRNVKGHIEVFLDGKFQFSADTKGEALKEIKDELLLKEYRRHANEDI